VTEQSFPVEKPRSIYASAAVQRAVWITIKGEDRKAEEVVEKLSELWNVDAQQRPYGAHEQSRIFAAQKRHRQLSERAKTIVADLRLVAIR
jgi:hypothetical protein